MGFRESLGRRRGLIIALTLCIVVIALGTILYPLLGGGADALPAGGPQASFSDDDGKTTFKDDAAKLPPFDHKGKQAVRAFVVSDDRGETVIYLERYTAAGKQLKTHPRQNSSLDDPAASDPGLLGETEVKRPGDKEWVKKTDRRAQQIMQAR